MLLFEATSYRNPFHLQFFGFLRTKNSDILNSPSKCVFRDPPFFLLGRTLSSRIYGPFVFGGCATLFSPLDGFELTQMTIW